MTFSERFHKIFQGLISNTTTSGKTDVFRILRLHQVSVAHTTGDQRRADVLLSDIEKEIKESQ